MRIQSLLVVPVIVLGLIAITALGIKTALSVPTPMPTVNTAAIQAPDYSPIPDPAWDEPGLDFGRLTAITTVNGQVTLHLDREKYYTETKAATHNSGGTLLDDYLVEDLDGDQELTFTLDPKASIQAGAELSSNGEQVEAPETLTPAELIQNLKELDLPTDPDAAGPLVWLRHTGGANGPVTAVAEQFVP